MIKVIIPPTKDPLRAKDYLKACQNALNACAKGAKADFGTTTRTWNTKPEFSIDASKGDRRIVGTDDEIFKYVDEGTQPHIIRPKRAKTLAIIGINSRPKTRPGFIGSTQGGRDNTNVYTRVVHHPGTEARKLTIAIRDKWSKQMVLVFDRALAQVGRVTNVDDWE